MWLVCSAINSGHAVYQSDLEVLAPITPGCERSTVSYLCGSPAMVDAVPAVLATPGTPADRIRTESYD